MEGAQLSVERWMHRGKFAYEGSEDSCSLRELNENLNLNNELLKSLKVQVAK